MVSMQLLKIVDGSKPEEKSFAMSFDLGFDLSLSNSSSSRGGIAALNWTDFAPSSNCAL